MNDFSLIIPAYNEEYRLKKFLENLNGLYKNKFEIIVVCNGCYDNTVEIAKGHEPKIRVIETSVASKTNALNFGDKAAQFWPRIYADADVLIDVKSLYALKKSLCPESVLSASPVVINKLEHSSWPVRAFYKVWTAMRYNKKGMIGCGIYALSKKGRERFNQWPNIIADDGYIRAVFSESERTVCGDATVVVQAPRKIRDLILVKTRSQLGRYELKQKFSDIMRKERQEKDYMRSVIDMMCKPNLWLPFTVYLMVNLIFKIRAKIQVSNLEFYKWERDISTRNIKSS